MNTDIPVSILIVDDRSANLTALTAALAGMNLNIVTATSGMEALRYLLTQEFAVVLLDVNMPIIDGFETATLIRSRPRSEHLPIIFITAERLSDNAKLQGYALGAVDYILSPVLPQILCAKVTVFADLFRLRAQIAGSVREVAAQNIIIEQQNRQLIETNQSLSQLNTTLERRIAQETTYNREKDLLLIHQSRLALMGEMISNIAHQWRQPLNALALVLGNIQDAEQHHDLTAEWLANKIAAGQRLIEKMTTTINDFRDFFRPDKNREVFNLHKPLLAAIALVEPSFKASGINFVTELIENTWNFGIANEYSQVVLNLFSNAREAILAQASEAGQIRICLDRVDQQVRLTVTDNGGGIAESALPHIFEPYFSTKPGGIGIGLYMSKMIIEQGMGGQISACNISGGAQFTVLTPLAERPNAE